MPFVPGGARRSRPPPCRRPPAPRRCRPTQRRLPLCTAPARPVGDFEHHQPERAPGPAAPPAGRARGAAGPCVPGHPPFLMAGGTVDPDPRRIQGGSSPGTARPLSPRGPLRTCPAAPRGTRWVSRAPPCSPRPSPVCGRGRGWLCHAWGRTVGRRSPGARVRRRKFVETPRPLPRRRAGLRGAERGAGAAQVSSLSGLKLSVLGLSHST